MLGKTLLHLVVLSLLLTVLAAAGAQAEPPPLPLHAVEGAGGVFATLTAYLVNPPTKPGQAGKPAVAVTYIGLGHDRDLRALTLTESVSDRVELGFSTAHLSLGDLPAAIQGATGVLISADSVTLNQFNGRVLLVKETPTAPAVTVGLHYKQNHGRDSIDRDLDGVLTAIGVKDSSGLDVTLYASKLFTKGARPVLVSAGLRSTNAAHTGLLGFTGDRSLVAEGNVVLFATKQLLLAAEYRQKPNSYTALPGLVEREDDWWVLAAAYIVNPRTTVSGGLAHFGHVLNHTANTALGVQAKYEF